MRPWTQRTLLTFSCLLMARTLLAANITLQWNANTESDLAGYRLFQSSNTMLGMNPAGARADNTIIKTQIAPAETTALVTGLQTKTVYYFRLTAFDTSDNESDFNVDNQGNPAEVLVFLPDDTAVQATQKFLSPGLLDGRNDAATFGPLTAEVTIFNLKGRKIYHATASGGSSLVWACKDDGGKAVASGVYIARLKQTDGSISYQTFTVAK